VKTKLSLAGAWKQHLWWSSDWGQGPEDCSWRTDQQWQTSCRIYRCQLRGRGSW